MKINTLEYIARCDRVKYTWEDDIDYEEVHLAVGCMVMGNKCRLRWTYIGDIDYEGHTWRFCPRPHLTYEITWDAKRRLSTTLYEYKCMHNYIFMHTLDYTKDGHGAYWFLNMFKDAEEIVINRINTI